MEDAINLIFKNPPKRLDYLLRLKDFDETDFFQKTKNFLTTQEKTKAFTISKWCEIVDDPENENSEHNNSIREFLQLLVDENVLIETDVRGEPPNEVSLYRLDKKELRRVWSESLCYLLLKELNIETINQEERFKSVVTDVGL
jgi:hypothetical protein